MFLKCVKLIKWLLNLNACDISFQPPDSSPGGGVGTEDGESSLGFFLFNHNKQPNFRVETN